MDLNKLSSWLSITANLGVIAGIVFLGIEIEQNNKLLRAEASLNMLQNRISVRNQTFEDPEIAQIMLKAEKREPLSEIEQYRIKNRIEASILGWEWEYEQFLEGNIENIPLSAWRDRLNSPVYQHVGWRSVEGLLTEEFRRLLNETILEN